MTPHTARRAPGRRWGRLVIATALLCLSGCGASDDAALGGEVGADVPDHRSTDATPAPSPWSPTRAPDSMANECRDEGYTVCGFVTQDGRPVPGLIIEAKFGDQNQTTTTNDRGAYGLTLQIPVVDLLCEESDEMLEANLLCQPAEGAGAPITVESDESGRIVNFVIEPV